MPTRCGPTNAVSIEITVAGTEGSTPAVRSRTGNPLITRAEVIQGPRSRLRGMCVHGFTQVREHSTQIGLPWPLRPSWLCQWSFKAAYLPERPSVLQLRQVSRVQYFGLLAAAALSQRHLALVRSARRAAQVCVALTGNNISVFDERVGLEAALSFQGWTLRATSSCFTPKGRLP